MVEDGEEVERLALYGDVERLALSGDVSRVLDVLL